MKLILIVGATVAVLLAASGSATASWERREGPSAFPRYKDPWANWGRQQPGYEHPRRHSHRYYVPHRYVWIPGQWWWNGWQWTWIPGHWHWR
jgi:hypothetical protein